MISLERIKEYVRGINNSSIKVEDPNDVIGRKILMYAFKDRKTKYFDTPVFCMDKLSAGRHYTISTQRKDSLLGTYPEDFDFYCLGKLSLDTGEFEPCIEKIYDGRNIR